MLKSVSASFAPLQTLTVAVNGSGTVTSSPAGIACPTTCSATFAQGISVNLSASPSSNIYRLLGWSGACSGAGACTVTMNSANSVGATFALSTTNILTIAGQGNAGYTGDGGPATSAWLDLPQAVAVDVAGNLYIADTVNHRIRKATASTGIMSTVAGNGTSGSSGDGGAATSAEIASPYSVAVDAAGNIYIADVSNYRIRKVTVSTGIISTVAGNGTAGYSGDGGPATSAELHNPYGAAVDAAGNIYIAEFSNACIRKVTASTGTISTVAGNGTAGYSGDGGAATSAQLQFPKYVAVDTGGNIYIADEGNNRVRKVTAPTGIISTVAGDGTAQLGSIDGVPPTSVSLNPDGVAVDIAGDIYITDRTRNKIRAFGP